MNLALKSTVSLLRILYQKLIRLPHHFIVWRRRWLRLIVLRPLVNWSSFIRRISRGSTIRYCRFFISILSGEESDIAHIHSSVTSIPSGSCLAPFRVPLLATENYASILLAILELLESGNEDVLVISVLIFRFPGLGDSDF